MTMWLVSLDKFTDRARRILSLAADTAKRRYHRDILPEHIILGMAEENNSIAKHALIGFGVHLGGFAEKISQLDHMHTCPSHPGHPGVDQNTVTVLREAIAAAESMKHNYVGSEHLLLGCLTIGRGVINTMLREKGITACKLEQEIRNILGLSEMAVTTKPGQLIEFFKGAMASPAPTAPAGGILASSIGPFGGQAAVTATAGSCGLWNISPTTASSPMSGAVIDGKQGVDAEEFYNLKDEVKSPERPTCKYWHAVRMQGVEFEFGADTFNELLELILKTRPQALDGNPQRI